MKSLRPHRTNLSVGEQRVLDAFYCGRLPAGRVSAALADARAAAVEPVTTVPAPARPRAVRRVASRVRLAA
jgi:hypothetical protein